MSDWAERESLIASELPDYPEEWPADQRIAAYWHALYHTGLPSRTKDWHTVWKLAQRDSERRARATP